jgi:hypothetical protein
MLWKDFVFTNLAMVGNLDVELGNWEMDYWDFVVSCLNIFPSVPAYFL